METTLQVQICNMCESTNVHYDYNLNKFICNCCGQHMADSETHLKHITMKELLTSRKVLLLLIIVLISLPGISQFKVLITNDSLIYITGNTLVIDGDFIKTIQKKGDSNVYSLNDLSTNKPINIDSVVLANTHFIHDTLYSVKTDTLYKHDTNYLVKRDTLYKHDTTQLADAQYSKFKAFFPNWDAGRNYFKLSGDSVKWNTQTTIIGGKPLVLPVDSANILIMPNMNVFKMPKTSLTFILDDGGGIYVVDKDSTLIKDKQIQELPTIINGRILQPLGRYPESEKPVTIYTNNDKYKN